MSKWIQTLRAEEDGSVAAEYGILIAFIAVIIIAGATALGASLNGLFNTVAGKF